MNARGGNPAARTLRDVFGWSRPFAPGMWPGNALEWLRDAGLLDETGNLLRSRVRFAGLGSALYAHSAYPTLEADAVFFGPDTYRFAALIEAGERTYRHGGGALGSGLSLRIVQASLARLAAGWCCTPARPSSRDATPSWTR